MKCYNCKKIIRTKGAHYCPFCGRLQHVKRTISHYTELTDENQMERIEKILVIINQNITNMKG